MDAGIIVLITLLIIIIIILLIYIYLLHLQINEKYMNYIIEDKRHRFTHNKKKSSYEILDHLFASRYNNLYNTAMNLYEKLNYQKKFLGIIVPRIITINDINQIKLLVDDIRQTFLENIQLNAPSDFETRLQAGTLVLKPEQRGWIEPTLNIAVFKRESSAQSMGRMNGSSTSIHDIKKLPDMFKLSRIPTFSPSRMGSLRTIEQNKTIENKDNHNYDKKLTISEKSFHDLTFIEEKDVNNLNSSDDVSNYDTPTNESTYVRQRSNLRRQSVQIRLKSSLIFLDQALSELHTWDFDIFEYARGSKSSGHFIEPLVAIGYSLLRRFNLISTLQISTNTLFIALEAIARNYRNVPFHNQLHAADVCQSVAIFLHETGLSNILEPHELFTVIIAALCHDLDHPGVNNTFLIQSRDPLALLYNDINVLENHHASASLTLLSKVEYDIFASFDIAQRKSSRQLFIALILATDLKHHFEIVNDFKARCEKLDAFNNIQDTKANLKLANDLFKRSFTHHITVKQKSATVVREKRGFSATVKRTQPTSAHMSTPDMTQWVKRHRIDSANLLVILKMCMKCADLGHPAKKWKLHLDWTNRITQEMYAQGDREMELNIPISPFMDRTQDHARPRSQLGFFSFLVGPMWHAFTNHFTILEPTMNILESNHQQWITLDNNPDIATSVLQNTNSTNDLFFDTNADDTGNIKRVSTI